MQKARYNQARRLFANVTMIQVPTMIKSPEAKQLCTKSLFVGVKILAMTWLLVFSVQSSGATDQPPNFLVIIADDQDQLVTPSGIKP